MDYDCKNPETPNDHYFSWNSIVIGETVPHWARCWGCDRTHWELEHEPQTQGPKIHEIRLPDVQTAQGTWQQQARSV